MPEPPVDPFATPGNANFVMEQWSNPCNAPFIVYARTFLPAALQAFKTLLEFDELDVIRFIYRPRGLFRGGHGRAGRFRRYARKIAPLEKMQGRFISNGVRHMWIIDTVSQRWLFAFLLVDVVSEFTFRWTTLLFNDPACNDNVGAKESIPGVLLTLGAWHAGQWPTLHYDEGTIVGTAFGFACGGTDTQCMLSLSVHNPNEFFPCTVSIRINALHGLGSSTATDSVVLAPGEGGSMLIDLHTLGTVDITPDARTQGPAVMITEGAFVVTGRPPSI